MLRDLGSRNGTFVNAERVSASRNVPLTLGDRLAFGKPDIEWVLEDDTAPLPMVVSTDGRVLIAEEDLIALPSADSPLATLFADSTGEWILELTGSSRTPILAGQSFVLDGETWRFSAPAPLNLTSLADGYLQRSVLDMEVCFTVSRDEESLSVELRDGAEAIKLAPRAFHYLLLTLARARASDQSTGVEDSVAGWLYQDELARGLGISPNSLNVDIFRARKQVAALGLLGGADIIERRPRAGQLRIGCAKLSIRVV